VFCSLTKGRMQQKKKNSFPYDSKKANLKHSIKKTKNKNIL
jgi:hypothetical protein